MSLFKKVFGSQLYHEKKNESKEKKKDEDEAKIEQLQIEEENGGVLGVV